MTPKALRVYFAFFSASIVYLRT